MTFIIAEAGVNHDGSLDKARALIDAAIAVGADAVKFQTFSPDLLDPPGERRDMLRGLVFSAGAQMNLKAYADGLGIEFMSTPFDVGSLRFLVNEIGVKRIKIASGHLDNWPLLDAARESGLPILLSTGMADRNKIAAAWSYLHCDVTLMHCTSAYPCPDDDVNLNAIRTLMGFGHAEIGFSDHSEGIVASLAAVAMGATVIEKHLTLDRNAQGPDHKASAEPDEFAEMVKHIRLLEKQMGDGVKRTMPSEVYAISVADERRLHRKVTA